MNVIHCRHPKCQTTAIDGCRGPCLTDAVKAFNDKVSGKRKPLTDEQISDLWIWSATAEAERTASTQIHAFARAVERAHGIE